METATWVKKQEELFQLYFKNYGDSINLEFLVKALKDESQKWQDLYQIFKDGLEDFDDFSNILEIKEIECRGKDCLIFKFFPFDYLVVDLKDRKVLTETEAFDLLSEDIFVDNFGEQETKNFNLYYSFAEGDDIFASSLVEFYKNNRDTMLADNHFYYSIPAGECRTSISINITNLKVTLGFNYFGEVGRCNYVFLDSELVAYGASNADGNKESLVKMGSRVRDINIPRSEIPEYILNIVDNFGIKENQDDDLGTAKVLSIG